MMAFSKVLSARMALSNASMACVENTTSVQVQFQHSKPSTLHTYKPLLMWRLSETVQDLPTARTQDILTTFI